METFAELHKAWTDEVDEAHPSSWSVPGSGSLDVPDLG
jgi:hypothetical protein